MGRSHLVVGDMTHVKQSHDDYIMRDWLIKRRARRCTHHAGRQTWGKGRREGESGGKERKRLTEKGTQRQYGRGGGRGRDRN